MLSLLRKIAKPKQPRKTATATRRHFQFKPAQSTPDYCSAHSPLLGSLSTPSSHHPDTLLAIPPSNGIARSDPSTVDNPSVPHSPAFDCELAPSTRWDQ